MFRLKALFLSTVCAALFGLAIPAFAEHVESGKSAPGHGARLVMPIMNPARGMNLFVDKGCVACHAINGVGGHDAPAMDAHTLSGLMNPFDFAAKMWNHAPAMIAAQENAFGEQIYFTGEELADMIAFIHDDDAQHSFSQANITEKARTMMEHEHGDAPAVEDHAPEIGHTKEPAKAGHPHAAGAKAHKD
jgi:mono/diheme cytochrome c family protein